MSPLAVLVGAFFWTWMWGDFGLLLATPLTVCLVVLGQHVPQLRMLDVLFGQAPEFSPATSVYQRLLAFDMDVAANIVEDFVADNDLAFGYDDVLLPVLCLAMSDRSRENLDDDCQYFILEAIRQIMRNSLLEALSTLERLATNRALRLSQTV